MIIIFFHYMTSFFATTFSFIPNRPETVTATLVSSRQKLFSSIVPVILSTDDLWEALCDVGGNNLFRSTTALQDNFLRLFSFSDSTTMQFTQKLKFFKDDECLSISLLTKLIDKTRYFNRSIKHIVLTDRQTIFLTDQQTLRALIPLACSKLVNLHSFELTSNIPICGIADSDLELICNLTLLRKLNLAYCPEITNAGIAHIAKLKALEELELEGLDRISELPPFNELKSLKLLQICACASITDSSFDFTGDLSACRLNALSLYVLPKVGDPTFMNLKKLPNLFTLKIEACTNATSTGFGSIGDVKYLRHLQFYSSEANTSDISGRIGSALNSLCSSSLSSSLESLEFLVCTMPDAQNLRAAPGSLPMLDRIEFKETKNVSDEFLTWLSIVAPVIRVLRISECQLGAFGDAGFRSVAEFRDLEVLEISSHGGNGFSGYMGDDVNLPSTLKSVTFRACSIDNAGLASSLKSLTKLEELCISQCSGISSKGLEDALETASSSSLKKLQASGCASLKNIRFFSQLETLEVLDLSRCRNLSFNVESIGHDVENPDEVIRAAEIRANNLAQDYWLDGKMSEQLKAGIPVFSLKCLKSLDISYCPHLRDTEYDHLEKSILAWPVLTSLNLLGCEGLDNAWVDILSSFPFSNIEFLSIDTNGTGLHSNQNRYYYVSQEVINFVHGAPHLRRFRVSAKVTDLERVDESLRKIAYVFEGLQPPRSFHSIRRHY